MKNPKTIAQKQLCNFLNQTYFVEIPLQEMFQIIENNGGLPVDESGEKWSGFICGSEGYTSIKVINIKGIHNLNFSWYHMPSGKWEIVGYLS